MVINEVSRSVGGEWRNHLVFEPGVNVIVGERNTGKTKWMETIDYLMGDEISAEQRATDDIFAKYDSARMVVIVNNTKMEVERRWRQEGVISKVYVNGEAISLKDYRTLLMDMLKIPIVHYPQGDPYGPRTWPELGWRSLFRHIYRRQRFWSEIADKQPESEQHACLMQFLGVAEKLFSQDFGNLVRQQKRISELETQRDQFMSMLQEIARELVDAKELGVALTPQSIDSAIARLRSESDRLQAERAELLRSLRESAIKPRGASRSVTEELTDGLVRLQKGEEAVLSALEKTRTRLDEVQEFRRLILEEKSRMERAQAGGEVLTNLKITHCPACDQELQPAPPENNKCYLCEQDISDISMSNKRLEFELEQLEVQQSEADDMVKALLDETDRLRGERDRLADERTRLEQALVPVRAATAAILPPEVAVYDVETGRAQEKVRQLERIRTSLGKRELLSEEIKRIQHEVGTLEAKVAEKTSQIDFADRSDAFADGMNTYLNRMTEAEPGAWIQKAVDVIFSERSFAFKVGPSTWSTKLGGTLTLYFLLSYHYALLTLTKHASYNYPGLALIDLPAEMLDGSSVADKENFVMIPFVKLLADEAMKGSQLIAAGSAFEGLNGAHRIELTEVWK